MRTYGIGYMKTPEDITRCITAVHGGGRWPSFHQCHRKRGHGVDGLYCKIHDPVAVKKREDERSANWRKRWEIDSSPRLIYASTAELIAELEKRRPSCDNCANNNELRTDHLKEEGCDLNCVWMGYFIDNFHPTKEPKNGK